ncbi:DNRLRE domain-containing protein [Cohnella ginsengisoli]|uniref:DNRLRE domain-containing protein n=1 Tax=Cohnella ginsengisoli TaxID=425004 RepID=A0A9X4KNM4_9BACL|nr:DNRLRE domain-containing protein [Cohnella ginsengisoli]MDG0795121.1 DNRLRE domain-containing protein [Cohnella ginsengisoli]
MKARSMFRLLSRIKLQMLLAIVLAVPSIAMAGTANAEPDATGTFAGKLLANCEYRYSGDSSNSTVYCPDTVSIGSNAGQSFTGMLKFDLSGFSGTVLEADLELFVTNNYANDEGSPELTIYKYNGSWTAPGTTPATDALPAFYGGMHSRTFNVTGKDGEWVKFNIAPLVRDSIAKGENELVLALAGSWADEGMRFFHYLSFNTLVPKLNIAYTTSPIQLPSPHTRIAAGDGFTLSLQDDGTVKAYGWIKGSKIEVPDNLTEVQAVYASNDCGYAIRAGGIVEALGDGCAVPVEVPNGNVVGLVLDGNAPAVLKNDGTMISWGSGQYKMPVEWEKIHAPFKSVSGGYNHAATLTWDNDVVSWGSASMGATDVPEDLPETTAIASGVNHTVALLKDGTVRLWGYYGVERPPAGLSNVGAIYANDNYSVAVLKDSGGSCRMGRRRTAATAGWASRRRSRRGGKDPYCRAEVGRYLGRLGEQSTRRNGQPGTARRRIVVVARQRDRHDEGDDRGRESARRTLRRSDSQISDRRCGQRQTALCRRRSSRLRLRHGASVRRRAGRLSGAAYLCRGGVRRGRRRWDR